MINKQQTLTNGFNQTQRKTYFITRSFTQRTDGTTFHIFIQMENIRRPYWSCVNIGAREIKIQKWAEIRIGRHNQPLRRTDFHTDRCKNSKTANSTKTEIRPIRWCAMTFAVTRGGTRYSINKRGPYACKVITMPCIVGICTCTMHAYIHTTMHGYIQSRIRVYIGLHRYIHNTNSWTTTSCSPNYKYIIWSCRRVTASGSILSWGRCMGGT